MSVLEFNDMVVVESVFHHCRFVWLSNSYVLVVLLCSGLCRSTRLSDVHLVTLTGYALLPLRSRCLDQDTSKVCPLTPHFIMLVVRGPEVSKGTLWLNAAACESHWRRTLLGKTFLVQPLPALWPYAAHLWICILCVLLLVSIAFPGSAVPQSSRLHAAAVGEITQPTIGAVWSSRTSRQHLQSMCLLIAARGAAHPATLPCRVNWVGPFTEHENLGPGWNHILHGNCVKTTPLTDPYPLSWALWWVLLPVEHSLKGKPWSSC